MAFVSSLSVPLTGFSRNTLAVTPLRNSTFYRPLCTPTPPRYNSATKMIVTFSSAFKTALLEEVIPLEFGRKIVDVPRKKEEVQTLIRQLESSNPSPAPLKDSNLSGIWEMLYTTSTSILRISLPPFLRPVRITQVIDVPNLYARNEEEFKLGPFRITNAVEADLEPVNDKLVNVKFTRFILGGLLKFNVKGNDRFRGELEVTYLDKDLRVSRGQRGNTFVLQRRKDSS